MAKRTLPKTANKVKPLGSNAAIDRYIDRVLGDEDQSLKAYDFSRDGDASSGTNDLWSEEVKAWADMTTIESLFYTEDWVFILTDLCANKVSSQPLLVMKKQMVDGKESVDYADTHPLNKLISNPNPMQDYHSWMYNLVVQYILLGNSIQWYSKPKNWLTALRTSLTSVEFGENGTIASYSQRQQSEDNPLTAGENSKVSFAPDEIIHIRRPNPASLLWGLTPFVPGRKSILFNRYSTDYLNSFYLKQATPGMVLEMDRQVNEQQALRQLRQFELAYTGRKNQRRTMILPKGIKATPTSLTIADQQIVSLIQMNRETIINLLKVPKQELGLQAAGSLGSEEYKVALRNFWEATLIPCCRLIEGAMNKFFVRELGDSFFFKFDLSGVQALQDDQMKKALLAKEMLLGGLSVNEVRTKVWEEQEVPGPANELPFVSKPPPVQGFGFSEPPKDEVAPAADLEEEDTGIALAPIQELEEPKVIIPGTQKIKDIMSKRRGGWVDGTVKELDEVVLKKDGRELFAIAMETLTSMAEVAGPIIKKNLVETKAADMPSKSKLKREITKAFAEFEELWVNEYIKILKSSVNLGYDQQLDLVLNEKDKAKIQALKERAANGRRAILEERGIESFSSISKTHTERIMKEITKGVQANETIGQITDRVANTFANPDEMRAKAETIARTETLTAVSIGQGAALENAAQVIPGLKKAWLNAGDDRVRDAHEDTKDGGVSGEVVDADEEFSNGLRWPRDTNSADASQVINCRCTLIMLPPGEDLEV